MNIQEEHFDQRDVEQYCMGAGIIPISVCPHTRVPHLLLGRERWVPSWKGSCRWSGFEGARKECESTRMSAAREFVEESMGCVRLTSTQTFDRLRDVITKLDLGHFWKRIVLRIDTERRIERYHTTFLVPVPWSPDTPQRFFDARIEVEQVDRLVQEWNCMRPSVIGELGEVIGPIEFGDTGVRIEKSLETSPCILRRPWRRVDGVLQAIFTDPSEIKQIQHWSDLRERVQRAVERCVHPCISHERDDRWRLIQSVHINADHLEKDQIRWWSIHDLNAVIDGQGHVGTDRFRPYFLPVLQTALGLVRERMEELSWTTTPAATPAEALCTLCAPSEEDPSTPEALDAPPVERELTL